MFQKPEARNQKPEVRSKESRSTCLVSFLPADLAAVALAKTGRASSFKRRAFTLIELLVVMAIVAIMIGIAVPAMNSLGRANAVSSGSNQLANTLMLARAKAITDRTHVRVVFSENANTNKMVYGKISYAVLSWTNKTADAAASWIYLDRWQHMPQGAFFITNSSFTFPTTVPFPTNSASGVTMPCIEFKSTGAPTSSSYIDIAIQEGIVVDGVIRNSMASNTLTNRIYAFTGRVKVLR